MPFQSLFNDVYRFCKGLLKPFKGFRKAFKIAFESISKAFGERVQTARLREEATNLMIKSGGKPEKAEET